MKKTLIIVSIILLVGAVGIGAFWYLLETPREDAETGEPAVGPRTFAPFDFITDIFEEEVATTAPTGDGGAPISETRSVYALLQARPGFTVTDAFVTSATFVPHALGTTTPDERLRYIERETGHVYDLSLASGATERISNTTIPRVQEALWGNGGEFLAVRYLDADGETVQTFAGTLTPDDEGGQGSLEGAFLPQNIHTIALHPSESRVFYLLETSAGVVGRIFDAATGQTASLFSSPLTEWTASWKSPSTIFLHTKPSFGALGFGYLLNPASGVSTRVLGNTLALTGLPGPSGDILVGSMQSDILALSFYDTSSGARTALALSTLPEKCSWLDTSRVLCAIPHVTHPRVPDAWYEGSVFFDDSVWIVDVTTNITDYLFDSTVLGTSFDATHLSVSGDEAILAFINKKDARLWVASLSAEAGLSDAPFPSF